MVLSITFSCATNYYDQRRQRGDFFFVALISILTFKTVSCTSYCAYYPNYPDTGVTYWANCAEYCCSGISTTQSNACCPSSLWWLAFPSLVVFSCCAIMCLLLCCKNKYRTPNSNIIINPLSTRLMQIRPSTSSASSHEHHHNQGQQRLDPRIYYDVEKNGEPPKYYMDGGMGIVGSGAFLSDAPPPTYNQINFNRNNNDTLPPPPNSNDPAIITVIPASSTSQVAAPGAQEQQQQAQQPFFIKL